jgi:hypothetical protein
MNEPYIHQLLAIRSMLKSPQLVKMKEAYKNFYELWLEYRDDSGFCQETEGLYAEFPQLLVEIEILQQKIDSKSSFETKQNGNDIMNPKPKKIFVSYSHNDEKYKDELIKILIPLQDEGILQIWHDREIDPGDDWFQNIKDVMNSCDLALLLISADFLASRFIRDKELRRLFERRKEEGLRVVPIIIRHCLWKSNGTLKGIQCIPTDGKPVSSFEDRDQVWTDVGQAIEKLLA